MSVGKYSDQATAVSYSGSDEVLIAVAVGLVASMSIFANNLYLYGI